HQALARRRQELLALPLRRVVGSRRFQASRHQIDEVPHLLAQGTPVLDLRWPMHNERGADAALVRIMLVPAKGRVAGVAPAGARADIAVRAADLLQLLAAVQDVV